MLQCSKCHRAWYCGPECQKEDWKGHKKMCKQLALEFTTGKLSNVMQRMELGTVGTAGDLKRLEKAVQVQRAQGGKTQALLSALALLAETQRVAGMLNEALKNFNECVELYKTLERTDNYGYKSTLARIGGIYVAQGRHAAGRPLLQEAVQHLRGDLGLSRDPTEAPGGLHRSKAQATAELTASLNDLAEAHNALGESVPALRCWEESVAASRAAGLSEDPNVANVLGIMGLCYAEQGRLVEGLAVLEEALRIQRKHGLREAAAMTMESLALLRGAMQTAGVPP